MHELCTGHKRTASGAAGIQSRRLALAGCALLGPTLPGMTRTDLPLTPAELRRCTLALRHLADRTRLEAALPESARRREDLETDAQERPLWTPPIDLPGFRQEAATRPCAVSAASVQRRGSR
jgi:hypothetical protein